MQTDHKTATERDEQKQKEREEDKRKKIKCLFFSVESARFHCVDRCASNGSSLCCLQERTVLRPPGALCYVRECIEIAHQLGAETFLDLNQIFASNFGVK